MNKLSLFYGIPVFRAQSSDETAQLILFAGKYQRACQMGSWGMQNDSESISHDYQYYKPKLPSAKARQQRQLLAMLPGIGSSKANLLLDHLARYVMSQTRAKMNFKRSKG